MEKPLTFNRKVPFLRQIREKLGLSRVQLACKLDVGESTISRWESGTRVPAFSLKQMKALDTELATIGLRIKDLPFDTFGIPDKEEKEEENEDMARAS